MMVYILRASWMTWKLGKAVGPCAVRVASRTLTRPRMGLFDFICSTMTYHKGPGCKSVTCHESTPGPQTAIEKQCDAAAQSAYSGAGLTS